MTIKKPKIFCALNNQEPKKNTAKIVAKMVLPPLAIDSPFAAPIV
jgi:hypothetical protein